MLEWLKQCQVVLAKLHHIPLLQLDRIVQRSLMCEARLSNRVNRHNLVSKRMGTRRMWTREMAGVGWGDEKCLQDGVWETHLDIMGQTVEKQHARCYVHGLRDGVYLLPITSTRISRCSRPLFFCHRVFKNILNLPTFSLMSTVLSDWSVRTHR